MCLAEFLSVLSPLHPSFFFFPYQKTDQDRLYMARNSFCLFLDPCYFVSRTQAFHFLPLQTSNKLTAPNLNPTNNDTTFQFHNSLTNRCPFLHKPYSTSPYLSHLSKYFWCIFDAPPLSWPSRATPLQHVPIPLHTRYSVQARDEKITVKIDFIPKRQTVPCSNDSADLNISSPIIAHEKEWKQFRPINC